MGAVESVWAVIPVHNRRELTRGCLAALDVQTAKGVHIIVVDDGSTDGTAEMIAAEFPSVEVLRGDGNLWWSGSVNLGIERARAQGASAILLLNDDTTPAPDLVERLTDAALGRPGALIGAVATDSSGVLLYGGEVVDWRHARFRSLLDTLPVDEQAGVHDVTHLPGRGLLIPVGVFDEIGLFDAAHFPQAVADYDFTQHALRAGHANLVCFEARLVTFPGETANAKLREAPSLKKYHEHLFGIRGAGNLPRYVRYALRNCPPRYLASFVFLGVTRRVGGYARDWLISSRAVPGDSQ
jgi:GT2 family glycosyltransferase